MGKPNCFRGKKTEPKYLGLVFPQEPGNGEGLKESQRELQYEDTWVYLWCCGVQWDQAVKVPPIMVFGTEEVPN